jgi:hypothetical protein
MRDRRKVGIVRLFVVSGMVLHSLPGCDETATNHRSGEKSGHTGTKLVTRTAETPSGIHFSIDLPTGWTRVKGEAVTWRGSAGDTTSAGSARVTITAVEDVSRVDLRGLAATSGRYTKILRSSKLPHGGYLHTKLPRARLQPDGPQRLEVRVGIHGTAKRDLRCEAQWREQPRLRELEARRRLLERICLSVRFR